MPKFRTIPHDVEAIQMRTLDDFVRVQAWLAQVQEGLRDPKIMVRQGDMAYVRANGVLFVELESWLVFDKGEILVLPDTSFRAGFEASPKNSWDSFGICPCCLVPGLKLLPTDDDDLLCSSCMGQRAEELKDVD